MVQDRVTVDLAQDMTPHDILLANIEVERLELIPLERVLTEEAIVDDSHASELGQSMMQKRGQLTPILARARLDERGEVVYDVIDGFHRTEGKKKNGDEKISATVVYGCTDEEMYDLRILAASSVRSVQFPRIAQWITDSFASTRWAAQGVTVLQAYSLTANDRTTTMWPKNKPPINKAEVEEIKNWVVQKSRRWDRSVKSTHSILKLVSEADPELIRQVREANGGRSRSTLITPAKLSAIVEFFPGDYSVQRVLTSISLEKRLNTNETRQLANKLKQRIRSYMKFSDIDALAWTIKIDYESTNPLPIVAETEEENEPRTEHRSSSSKYVVRKKPTEGEISEVESLRERVHELEERLADSQPVPEYIDDWWRNATYLNSLERQCFELVMYSNQRLDAVSSQLKIPKADIISHIVSAFSKRNSMEPQRRPKK